jgi:hypothetical protein
MFGDKFNCTKCVRHRNHERIAKKQACNSVASYDILKTDDFVYKTCPGNFNDPFLNTIIAISKQVTERQNPFGGNFIDTPAKLVDVCNLVDNLIAKRRESDGK